MRVVFCVLLALWLQAMPVQAAEKPSAAPAPPSIEFVNLPLPVLREGRLQNYIFATIAVEFSTGSDDAALRKRAHIVRDSFLRTAHDRSLALADDPYSLDPAAAVAALTPPAMAGFGAKSVKVLKIVSWTSLRTRTRR